MMILTNTSAENALAPELFPSAATPVQLEEQEAVHAHAPGEENHKKSHDDSVKLSPEAVSALEEQGTDNKTKEKEEDPSTSSEEKGSSGQELTEEDKEVVQELKDRDQEVRTHEQAHVAAGGQYIRGGIKYDFQSGPDGKRYAVGGHVNIDTSPVANDPDATIRKMQTVRAAALAPAEPSGADRSVAATANQNISQAQAEKATQVKEEQATEVKEKEEKAAETKAEQKSSETGSEAASSESVTETPQTKPEVDTSESKSVTEASQTKPTPEAPQAKSISESTGGKEINETPTAPKTVTPEAPTPKASPAVSAYSTQSLRLGGAVDFAA